MHKPVLDENGQRLNGIRREKLRRTKDLQRLMEFRLLDDDFLAACCYGDTVCAELILRIILEKPDLRVLDVQAHVSSEDLVHRPVRLDIRAVDGMEAKLYARLYCPDCEPERKTARQYSSMMDAYLFKENKNPDSLPETWLIFLMENDIMGKGLPFYRIERCCPETGQTFGDGSHILYVNGSFRSDMPAGKLIHDLSCTDAADMYYDTLAERVRYFKETTEGTETMCRAMEKMRDQTYRDAKKKTAFRMFEAEKYTLEEIAGISGLTLEEVIKLKTGQDID